MADLSINIKSQRINNGIKAENLEKYFQSLTNNKISVGVHKDKGQDSINKMKWNEFGTNHIAKKDYRFFKNGKWWTIKRGSDIRIPARPVVRMYLYRSTLDNINMSYQNDIDIEKKSKLRNPIQSAEKVQSQLGEQCVVLQRQKMSMGGFAQIDTKGKNTESNTPLTSQIKGFNQPYFETGDLIGKIDYKVERR